MEIAKVTSKTTAKASALDLSIKPQPVAVAQAHVDDAKKAHVVVVTGF